MKIIEPSEFDLTRVEYTCKFCACRYAPERASDLRLEERDDQGTWKKPMVGTYCPSCGQLNEIHRFVFLRMARGEEA